LKYSIYIYKQEVTHERSTLNVYELMSIEMAICYLRWWYFIYRGIVLINVLIQKWTVTCSVVVAVIIDVVV